MARYARDAKTEVVGDRSPSGRMRAGDGMFLVAIVELILGVILTIWPRASLDFVCILLGLSFVVAGIYMAMQSVTIPGIGLARGGALAGGIGLVLAGLFFIAARGFIVGVFALIFGLMLLVGAIIKLGAAFDLRALRVKNWASELAMGIVMIVLSFALIISPFTMTDAMIRFLGILLIISALMSLWYYYQRKRGARY